jgi:hypothetical protein
MIPSTQEHGSQALLVGLGNDGETLTGGNVAQGGLFDAGTPKALRMNELYRVQSLLFTNITFSIYPAI